MADARSDRTRAVDARIDAGALRADLPVSAWGGPGAGLCCDACTEPVAATEMEIESDFRDGETLRFHIRCFSRWLARVQPRSPAAS
jgi:hypothetical protein